MFAVILLILITMLLVILHVVQLFAQVVKTYLDAAREVMKSGVVQAFGTGFIFGVDAHVFACVAPMSVENTMMPEAMA